MLPQDKAVKLQVTSTLSGKYYLAFISVLRNVKGAFGLFQHPIFQKWKKEPLETLEKFQKLSHSAEKNERGTLLSRPVLYVTFEK